MILYFCFHIWQFLCGGAALVKPEVCVWCAREKRRMIYKRNRIEWEKWRLFAGIWKFLAETMEVRWTLGNANDKNEHSKF